MSFSGGPDRFLSIYLNDHFAGSTGGVELARRLRSSNQDDAEFGLPLSRLCAEIEEDRENLIRLMEELAIARDPIKPRFARLAERLGRFKPNGQLTGYSPLSRVLELEILSGLIGGKIQLWNAMEQRFGENLDGFDFHALADRADRQGQRVEELHLRASQRAFSRQ
jgi:hypothetical protein